MSQSSILRKLSWELQQPIKSERQVVYVLAEVRKYLETLSPAARKDYRFLTLFCNWALHTEIDRDAFAIYNILDCYDVYDGNNDDNDFGYKESRFYWHLSNFSMLRKELKRFLSDHHLSTVFTESTEEWAKFLYLYLRVVAEVPIVYREDDLTNHNAKVLTLTEDPSQPGVILWNAIFQDGSEYTIPIDYSTIESKSIPNFFSDIDIAPVAERPKP